MSGVSPNGDYCRKAVMLKPELRWRSQNVRDARVMGYLKRRAARGEWNQPERNKCAGVNKTERSWRPEEHFDLRHGDLYSLIYLWDINTDPDCGKVLDMDMALSSRPNLKDTMAPGIYDLSEDNLKSYLVVTTKKGRLREWPYIGSTICSDNLKSYLVVTTKKGRLREWPYIGSTICSDNLKSYLVVTTKRGRLREWPYIGSTICSDNLKSYLVVTTMKGRLREWPYIGSTICSDNLKSYLVVTTKKGRLREWPYIGSTICSDNLKSYLVVTTKKGRLREWPYIGSTICSDNLKSYLVVTTKKGRLREWPYIGSTTCSDNLKSYLVVTKDDPEYEEPHNVHLCAINLMWPSPEFEQRDQFSQNMLEIGGMEP
ncbi:hypothetical protein STEG23_012507, partial [Scotinomys teguina]